MYLLKIYLRFINLLSILIFHFQLHVKMCTKFYVPVVFAFYYILICILLYNFLNASFPSHPDPRFLGSKYILGKTLKKSNVKVVAIHDKENVCFLSGSR